MIRFIIPLILALTVQAQQVPIDFARTMGELSRDSLTSDYKTSLKLLDSALNIAKSANKPSILGNLYDQRAIILTTTGREDDAVESNLKSIAYRKISGELSKVARSYGALGYQLRQERPENAQNYFLQGMRIAEDIQDSTELHVIYDNYGTFIGELGKTDSAFYYHRRSLKIKKAIADSIGLPYTYGHLAMTHLEEGNLQQALKYVDSSQAIRQKLNQKMGIAVGYVYYGDVYFAMGDWQNAEINFKKSYELSQQVGNDHLGKYALEQLYKTYDTLGDYKNAYENLQAFQTLQNKFVNEKSRNRIAELEVEFDTQEKENRILQQRAEITEKEMIARNRVYWIIGLAVLVLLLAVLGYLVYDRQRSRNEVQRREFELKQARAEVEAQNRLREQRLKISRDLHDNIGSQLTYIITSINMLKSTLGDRPEQQQKLDNIGVFTRQTIKELRDTIWAMNQNSISLETLQGRMAGIIHDFNEVSPEFTTVRSDFTTETAMELDTVAAMHIFRIVQEALNNAIKYSEAENINLIVSREDNQLRVHVTDNGRGFDQNTESCGNGIGNMDFRASEINGILKISSLVGQGTNVILEVPYDRITYNENRTSALSS